MSTMDSIEECKRCKGDRFVFYDLGCYVTEEFCYHCGSSFSEGPILKDDDTFELDMHGRVILESEEEVRFGVVCIQTKERKDYTPIEDLSEETLKKHIDAFLLPDVIQESSYITIYEDGEHKTLMGKLPEYPGF